MRSLTVPLGPSTIRAPMKLRLLLYLVASVGSATAAKDVMLWVMKDDAGGTVNGIVADVKAKMAFGVSSFGMCGYSIAPDFSGLVPQGATLEPVGAALRAEAPELKQVPLIQTGDATPNKTAWTSFLANATARSDFIASAVRLMHAREYDGFNLDMEQFVGKGSEGVDHDSFGQFLNEFADAVHGAGGRLSSDVDWCGSGHWWDGTHYDYMGMRCSDYAASRVDSVATMHTYETSKRGDDLLTHFKAAITPAATALGAKLRVGMDCQVGGGDNVTAAAMFAILDKAGVDKIALWHNGWYDYFGGALKAWALKNSSDVPVASLTVSGGPPVSCAFSGEACCIGGYPVGGIGDKCHTMCKDEECCDNHPPCAWIP